jgi:hypothetical protein
MHKKVDFLKNERSLGKRTIIQDLATMRFESYLKMGVFELARCLDIVGVNPARIGRDYTP